MTIVIKFNVSVQNYPEFPTITALKTYVKDLLFYVNDGSFDEQLIVLAEKEGLSYSTIFMLKSCNVLKVDFSPFVVSNDDTDTSSNTAVTESAKIGIAIGSFFFSVISFYCIYFLFIMKRDTMAGEKVISFEFANEIEL